MHCEPPHSCSGPPCMIAIVIDNRPDIAVVRRSVRPTDALPRRRIDGGARDPGNLPRWTCGRTRCCRSTTSVHLRDRRHASRRAGVAAGNVSRAVERRPGKHATSEGRGRPASRNRHRRRDGSWRRGRRLVARASLRWWQASGGCRAVRRRHLEHRRRGRCGPVPRPRLHRRRASGLGSRSSPARQRLGRSCGRQGSAASR